MAKQTLAEKRATEHPVLVDKAIAAAVEAFEKAAYYHASEKASVERYREKGIHPDTDTLRRLTLELDARKAELSDARAKYGGWTRYFLVTNHDGHIHNTLNCSTCNRGRYRDTSFAWLTELSGLDYEAAVEEYGKILCSVCFPDAPTDYTEGTNIKEAHEKEKKRNITALRKTPEFKAFKSKFDLIRKHHWHLEAAESTHKSASVDLEERDRNIRLFGEEEGGRFMLRRAREKAEAAESILKAKRGIDRATPKLGEALTALNKKRDELGFHELEINNDPTSTGNYFL
jgi:hypothetical protein